MKRVSINLPRTKRRILQDRIGGGPVSCSVCIKGGKLVIELPTREVMATQQSTIRDTDGHLVM